MESIITQIVLTSLTKIIDKIKFKMQSKTFAMNLERVVSPDVKPKNCISRSNEFNGTRLLRIEPNAREQTRLQGHMTHQSSRTCRESFIL